jgi:hypothetical protein
MSGLLKNRRPNRPENSPIVRLSHFLEDDLAEYIEPMLLFVVDSYLDEAAKSFGFSIG